MAAKVTKRQIDFSNVKDGGKFNKMRVPMGDYAALVVKVEDAPLKEGGDGVPMYLFTIKLKKFASSAYPYYCKLQENQLWKLRNLLVAAGMSVPKRKVQLDPSKIVGKIIGVTMEDDEYDGRPQSEIAAVFPASELDVDDIVADDADVDEEEDEDFEEEPEPAPKARKSKAAPVVADDDEDEDEEDEEEDEAEEEDDEAETDEFDAMDRTQLKRYIKKENPGYSVSRTQSDDDLREVARGLAGAEDEEEEDDEEDEEPAPPVRKKAKAKKATTVTDDELEELDLEDL